MKAKAILILATFSLAPWAVDAQKPLQDAEVRDLMINGNLSAYTGPCPCPFSVDKMGKECGENSVYSQSPGQMKCYRGDISDQEVAQYRKENNIDVPKLPWDQDKKEGY
jgi:hypothetical protein